jgi:hypothetical protein
MFSSLFRKACSFPHQFICNYFLVLLGSVTLLPDFIHPGFVFIKYIGSVEEPLMREPIKPAAWSERTYISQFGSPSFL